MYECVLSVYVACTSSVHLLKGWFMLLIEMQQLIKSQCTCVRCFRNQGGYECADMSLEATLARASRLPDFSANVHCLGRYYI